jgi:hypothetical protein
LIDIDAGAHLRPRNRYTFKPDRPLIWLGEEDPASSMDETREGTPSEPWHVIYVHYRKSCWGRTCPSTAADPVEKACEEEGGQDFMPLTSRVAPLLTTRAGLQNGAAGGRTHRDGTGRHHDSRGPKTRQKFGGNRPRPTASRPADTEDRDKIGEAIAAHRRFAGRTRTDPN